MSVESQETENRAWCQRQGWAVAGVVTDNDRSATRFATKQREGFKTIWSGLDDGRWGRVDVLVTWASSRNARRLDGYVDLRELCVRHGVRLAYKGRIFDLSIGSDRFQTGLDALLDERDAEEIRDGILRSHRASVAAGRPRGSIPYGYIRTYLPGQRRVSEQVPDPQTAPVVARIVADLLAGETLYAIAQRLNADAAPTPQQVRDGRRGRDVERAGWTSSMIRNMLAKPSLAGLRSHHGVVTGEGAWKPIVPLPEWRQVQALLAEPKRLAHNGGLEVVWLLSGIASCGVCGAWLRPMRRNGRMCYVCAGVTPTSPKAHVSRLATALDDHVVEVLLDTLGRPSVRAAVFAEPEPVAVGEDAATRKALDEAQARLAEYEEAAATGGVSASAFGRIEARLSAQIADLQRRLTPIPPVPPVVRRLVDADDVAVEWELLELQEQRVVLRAVFEKIAVGRVSQRGVRGFEACSVTLKVRGVPD